MVIKAISTVVVNAEMRNWVFVKVETDEAITGWGEASLEWHTLGVVGAVEDLSHFLVGEDPCRIEHLYQVMTRQGFWRSGVIGMSAISGIEMACWDILGKCLGTPVHQLLGGRVRERVRMYDHLGGGEMASLYLNTTIDQFTERARRSIADGYTAVKVLIVPVGEPLEHASTIRQAAKLMEALRLALGEEVDIMVDLHGRTTPAGAIRYIEALAPFAPYFIEEPCPPENVAGMAQVARATTVPIATGERLVTRFQFRELFESAACAVAQPDICHAGGLWEVRKIAALAESHYVSIAPHNPLGPIATAAAVQLDLVLPNFLIQEAIRSDVPWRDEVVTNTLHASRGYIEPPHLPGLGVEVNEQAAARHPYLPEKQMRYFHEDGAVADW
ncbi:MAG: galactonate dehydratase [Candidatus Dormibacteraeota bacterium]|uniref:Galactonate dehydratase n=1 Tax=Candidatus Dormiibacter inghamiae TaxID=3127013 RepID=A0A934NEQ8_9BACT|nr:galactonate dehydratase [Candidatus Dormibacteraeota bacterium]MBJ7606438.1 galactonate dehydratase [Candidatus Dormibacteraeota bacterium]